MMNKKEKSGARGSFCGGGVYLEHSWGQRFGFVVNFLGKLMTKQKHGPAKRGIQHTQGGSEH
jgi:hypothetical protein